MATLFSKLFDLQKGISDTLEPHDSVSIATCIVLLEIANADDEFTSDEKAIIKGILQEQFGLTDAEIETLMQEAARRIVASIDTWSLTRILAKELSEGERIVIMEAIWRVIYADGRLAGYEDALVHKISFLLGLTHAQMITAKLKIQKENRQS